MLDCVHYLVSKVITFCNNVDATLYMDNIIFFDFICMRGIIVFMKSIYQYRKIILADCFYSKIKQTLGACVSEDLPRLVPNLMLTTPVFTLKQGIILTFDLVLSFIINV